MLSPAKIMINPPVTVVIEGTSYRVKSAKELLNKRFGNKRPTIEVQNTLEALSLVAPILVNGASKGVSITWQHVKAFLKVWKGRLSVPNPFVSREEAEKRASVCSELNGGCPLHGEISGCLGCSGIADVMVKPPGNLPIELNGCGVCGCYLKVKVWLSPEVLRLDTRGLTYPDHCWMNEVD